jgi:hypothetical protein
MQQQQHADYDLLAIFSEETKADAAVAKLHKEGFSEDEVHQLAEGSAGSGQFREHGPNRARQDFFLQTRHAGPSPFIVTLLAIIGGLLLGAVTFAASFALPTIPEPVGIITGVIIGILLGGITGLLRRGRVQGAIGQDKQRLTTSPPPTQGARTVVALRFSEPDNISRKSRARAILLNNQGKIDRSVGQRE